MVIQKIKNHVLLESPAKERRKPGDSAVRKRLPAEILETQAVGAVGVVRPAPAVEILVHVGGHRIDVDGGDQDEAPGADGPQDRRQSLHVLPVPPGVPVGDPFGAGESGADHKIKVLFVH